MFMVSTNRSDQARTIRVFRRIHRITAILLFFFFFIMAATGILLGLKKHSGELIQDKTYSGTSTNIKDWLPLDSLYARAFMAFRDSISETLPMELDRVDVRHEKGVVKFVFENGFWGIQIDGATGDVLHIERRRSDFIEMLHDGSLADYYFGTSNQQIKLIYTFVMGTALLLFTITGFWLWYGPKQMNRNKRHRKN
jgi:uncharacterized iron-regulated membrane protein